MDDPIVTMANVVRLLERGFFPLVPGQVPKLPLGQIPGYLLVLSPEAYDGSVSDSTRRSFATRVVKSLNVPQPIVIVVPSMADLPPEICTALAAPEAGLDSLNT